MSDDSNQAMATPPPPTFPQENQGGTAPGQQQSQPQQQQTAPSQQQQVAQGPMQAGPGSNIQGMPGQSGPVGGLTGPIQGGQGYQQQGGTGQPNPGNIEMLHKVIDFNCVWKKTAKKLVFIVFMNNTNDDFFSFQAISQMEERGMQNDPRYQQLMAMANRTKQQQQGMNGPQGTIV